MSERSSDIKTDFEEACRLQYEGKLSDAIKLYQEIVERDPKCKHVYYNMGCASRDLGNFDGALEYFNRAVVVNAADFDAHYNIAEIYTRQKQYSAAIEAYRKSLAINPKQHFAHSALGYIYVNDLGEIDTGIIEFERALTMEPSCPDPHYHLAWAHHLQGNVSKTVEHLKKFVKSPKDNSEFSQEEVDEAHYWLEQLDGS